MTPGELLIYAAQAFIIVAATTAASAAIGLPHPGARLWLWRAVLLLCVALPFIALPQDFSSETSASFSAAYLSGAEAAEPRVVTRTLATWLPWIVFAGVIARLGWLLLGVVRLHHLRARSTPIVGGDEVNALRATLAPRAELRSTAAVNQPVTFSYLRPVVLLPDGFDRLAPDAQRAVICHELTHVSRRDWLWILGEEVVRAALWFNPAIWWVLAQIHLSREQVVDELVVARTGLRRAYMEALVHFAAAEPCPSPALPFLRRHHLAARLTQLSKEVAMSTTRLMGTLSLLALFVGATTIAALIAMPLNGSLLAAQGTGTTLEIRLAERESGPGLSPARVVDSSESAFLHADVLASNTDVVSARVVDGGNNGYSIAVEFNSTAAGRLSGATAVHIGKPAAVLLDGRVISAPTVRSAFGANALITGRFSRAEAESIAAALSRRGAQLPVESDEPGVVLPAVLTSVKPDYTVAALATGIAGDVLVSAVVGTDGLIRQAAIKQSLDSVHGLDQSALDSLQGWRFKPGSKDGMAVPVRVEMLMTFRLK